jgi:hypothetical protein
MCQLLSCRMPVCILLCKSTQKIEKRQIKFCHLTFLSYFCIVNRNYISKGYEKPSILISRYAVVQYFDRGCTG